MRRRLHLKACTQTLVEQPQHRHDVPIALLKEHGLAVERKDLNVVSAWEQTETGQGVRGVRGVAAAPVS